MGVEVDLSVDLGPHPRRALMEQVIPNVEPGTE